MNKHPNAKRYPYRVRVGACADYLIGVPTEVIRQKWGVKSTLVSYWIKQRKCFKLRREC